MTLEATLAYRNAADDYATQAAAVMLEAWSGLGHWNRADYERLLLLVGPILAGAVKATSDLSAGYYTAITGIDVTVDTAPLLARLPAQLLQPFTGLWHGLTEVPFDQAFKTGTSTAEATGKDIVHQAARDSAAHIDHQIPNRRYRRMLTGMSCSWCQFYSTRIYKTASSATFGHERCDCLIVPVQDISDDYVNGFNESIRTASGYDESVTTTEITKWGKANPARRRR